MALPVDTALLQRARDGSSEALSELLERCAPKLLALIRARLARDPGARGLRARLDSRDLLQNVLIKAMSNLDGLQVVGSRPLLGWLAQIAENELRDQVTHHRRQRRDLAVEVAADDAGDGLPAPLVARVRSASSRVVLRERTERLMEALGGLDDAQREVVLLRDFEELPWNEIGERLGRSADAARMLYARALAALTLRVRAAETAGAETAGAETAGAETAGTEAAGAERTGAESAGTERTGAETAGAETVGAETAGAERTGAETAGAETVGAETAGAERTGTESAGTERTGAETAGAETAGTEAAGAERTGAESAGAQAGGGSEPRR